MNARSVHHLLEVLAALDHLRAEANHAEAAYLDRLVAIVGLPPAASSPRPHELPIAFTTRLAARLKGWRTALLRLARVVALLPDFVRQTRKLARMRKAPPGGTWLIVAIASNRLSMSGQSIDVPRQLAALAKTVGGAVNDDMAQKMLSAPYIMLFDPLPISRLWPSRRKCGDDNVVIVDGVFLLWYMLLTWLSSVPRQCMSIWQLVQRCRSVLEDRSELSRTRLIRTVFYATALNTYSELLRGGMSLEGIFFTSNSTLTELLRAHLMENKDCRYIYEVMHGAGSIPAERFFASLISAGAEFGSREKHFFIPQVPNLPLYGVFLSQARYSPDVAINAYLNQYFIRHGSSSSSAYSFDNSGYHVNCGRNTRSAQPIILTIFGNIVSTYPASFAIECLIMSRIGQLRKSLRNDLMIVYVSHPMNEGIELDHPVFAEEQVRICRDSPFAWLISDLSVALVSSSIFEAVYFGASGFTPMVDADQVYTKAYLDLLSHPESDSFEDFIIALERFMTSCDRAPRPDVAARAGERLKLMRGWP
jgi:hypothetical protein